MKTLRLSATLMLLGCLTLGMADATIDEQIAAIQGAAPEERVELVNEFKETLSTLSSEERAEARSRVNQMKQTDDMQRTGQMQQTQAGSQAMQQGRVGAGVPADGHTPNRFMGNK